MSEEEKKVIRYNFNKTFNIDSQDDEKYLIVNVDYSSKTKVNDEEKSIIFSKLKSYMTNEFDSNKDNIIDIVSRIREITSSLEEGRLNVNISRLNSGEYVYYKNGSVDSCGAYKEMWSDIILVFNDKNGTDVRFKKEDFKIDNEEKKEAIYKELSSLFSIVITLNNMIKKCETKTSTNKHKLIKKIDTKQHQ